MAAKPLFSLVATTRISRAEQASPGTHLLPVAFTLPQAAAGWEVVKPQRGKGKGSSWRGMFSSGREAYGRDANQIFRGPQGTLWSRQKGCWPQGQHTPPKPGDGLFTVFRPDFIDSLFFEGKDHICLGAEQGLYTELMVRTCLLGEKLVISK